ncbi:MAG: hypothetical protein QXR62_04755 [Candidatus Bathyarchaeia archaeon]
MSERELYSYALQIVSAEESARLLAKLIGRVRAGEVKVEAPAEYLTSMVNYADRIVSGAFMVVDVDVAGGIDEFIAECLSSGFRIALTIDGRSLNLSYSDFEALSGLSEVFDAFKTDSTYCVRISGLRWGERLSLSIITEAPTKFKRIICIYHVRRS